MRNRNPSLFESQLLNKFFYTILGGRKTIVSKPVPLESIIDLYIDDKKKSLENIEGLVVLNIPYYAGGGIPWDNQYKQNIRDGLIEIIGFSSLVHCATMKACPLIVYYALGRSQLCLYDWSGTIHSYRGQEEELDAGMSHFSPLCCRLMANHGCSPLVTFISTIETLSWCSRRLRTCLNKLVCIEYDWTMHSSGYCVWCTENRSSQQDHWWRSVRVLELSNDQTNRFWGLSCSVSLKNICFLLFYFLVICILFYCFLI